MHNISPPKDCLLLGSANYRPWARKAQTFLEGNSLWEISNYEPVDPANPNAPKVLLDPMPTVPTRDAEATDASHRRVMRDYKEDLSEWRARRAQARHLIEEMVTLNLRGSIELITEPADLWLELKRKFDKKDDTLLLSLRDELAIMVYDWSVPAEEFFDKIQSLRLRIKDAGGTFTDEEVNSLLYTKVFRNCPELTASIDTIQESFPSSTGDSNVIIDRLRSAVVRKTL